MGYSASAALWYGKQKLSNDELAKNLENDYSGHDSGVIPEEYFNSLDEIVVDGVHITPIYAGDHLRGFGGIIVHNWIGDVSKKNPLELNEEIAKVKAAVDKFFTFLGESTEDAEIFLTASIS